MKASDFQRPAPDARQWIASALDCPPEALRELRPGPEEAGEDAGQLFYAHTRGGTTLAVRSDGTRAYITHFGSASDLAHSQQLLRRYGLTDIQVPQLREVQVRGRVTQKWIKVADSHSAECQWLFAGADGTPLNSAQLRAQARLLEELWREPEPDPERARQLHIGLALPGDEVARAPRDVFGRPLAPAAAADSHLQWLPDGICRTALCAYLALRQDALVAIPPVWMDPARLRAYFVAFNGPPRPLRAPMLAEALTALGVRQGMDAAAMDAVARAFAAGRLRPGYYPIASGTPPRPGRDARLEILLPAAGPEARPIEVRGHQAVARRHPPTEGVPGRNLLGEELPARRGRDTKVYAGANLWVEREGEDEVFYAGEDGVLKMEDGELAVVRLLKLNGDVDFRTGNLDFDGDVFIGGSLKPSFSVTSRGDVDVAGHVERGAQVRAAGDARIGGLVEGHRTRVEASGDVRVAHVREAHIVAGGDIALGPGGARHAQLRAGRRLLDGGNGHGGALVGGQAWAGGAIDLRCAGDRSGVRTVLVAGMSPEQAKRMDALRQQAAQSRAHILQLLEHFYLDRIDVGQIQNLIAAATGPRRRLLATYAHRLGELVQVYQRLLDEYHALQKHLRGNGAEIRIRQTAFAGVVIRMGGCERVLEQEAHNLRFFVEEGQLQQECLSRR